MLEEALATPLPQPSDRALDRDSYVGEPHVRDLRWLDVCRHPRVLDAVESVLGPNLVLVYSSVFIKQPGSPVKVGWHQDNTYWPSVHGTDVVTLWLAVDDADACNSAMQVIPGSHRGWRELETVDSGDDQMLRRSVPVSPEQEASAVTLEMGAGSLSIHDSFILHGSDANRSGRRRAGIHRPLLQHRHRLGRRGQPSPPRLPGARRGRLQGRWLHEPAPRRGGHRGAAGRVMRGGDLLVECLKAQGVRCIFGMPGTQNLQIYDSLLRRGAGAIDHYLVRHEYGATVMADGYARAGGDVGVALTVPGPGASNASTGLLQAYTDCVPVLLITGQHDSRHYGRDPAKLFHGLDQMSFFEPITRYREIARTAADIPRVVEQAFRVLRAPRPGTAMLEFPQDAVTGPADGLEVPDRVPSLSAGAPDEALLREAARSLGAASRPVLLAGNAVITGRARKQLRALAEKLRAPVVATRRGKGALPEDHELALLDIRGYLGAAGGGGRRLHPRRGLPLHLHRHEPVGVPLPAAPDPARSRGR